MLHVVLLMDEECDSCDRMLQELEDLRSEFPEMRIRERLLDDEPDLVSRLGIIATPALVVNNQLAFQGHPDQESLRTYLRNVQAGLHRDPEIYPPESEREEDVHGGQSTGSADPAWRGSGRRPGFGSHPGGRH